MYPDPYLPPRDFLVSKVAANVFSLHAVGNDLIVQCMSSYATYMMDGGELESPGMKKNDAVVKGHLCSRAIALGAALNTQGRHYTMAPYPDWFGWGIAQKNR